MAFLRCFVVCVCVVGVVFVTYFGVETLYITRCHKSTLSASAAAAPCDDFGNVVLKFLEYVQRSCLVNYKLLYICIYECL